MAYRVSRRRDTNLLRCVFRVLGFSRALLEYVLGPKEFHGQDHDNGFKSSEALRPTNMLLLLPDPQCSLACRFKIRGATSNIQGLRESQHKNQETEAVEHP